MANFWRLAKLSPAQARELGEAERLLGVDYLLAYQPATAGEPAREGEPEGSAASGGLPASALNPSQVECLQGLERSLGAVVVAYQSA